MDASYGRERDRFKASSHYVWRQVPSDILGEGSFGTVYRGLHKESCEIVAIKTFNRNTYTRPLATQLRELTIQKRLDHPNVVKLIEIEDELVPNRTPAQVSNNTLQGKVLIMEYCTEGSLYSIIEHPENQFGLDEVELIRFLSHITAGMKYLQENKIIHRDWKPSNILKTINDNGDIFYKLCDFGAARELESNQPFASIVGTEEYLHPEIFRRALLGGSTQYFFATSELWSVGVTLYHVATGQLPFRPYGGRKNREMMHEITYLKEPGVISGVQEEEKGPILWSKDLPKHCRLSRSFRRFLTKVLAGIMEPNQAKVWSFERFFTEVEQFLSKICVRACTSTDFASQNVYVDRNSDLKQFLKVTCEDLNVEFSDDIVLVQDGRLITKCVPFDLTKIAEKSRKMPLFFAVPSDKVIELDKLEFPKYPNFLDDTSIERDVETARVCCALGYWAMRLTSEQDLWKETCDKTAVCLIEHLKMKMKNLEAYWKLLKHHWRFISEHLETLTKFMFTETGKKHVTSKVESAKQVDNNISFQEREMLNGTTELRKVDEHFPVYLPNNLFFVLDRIGGSIIEIFAQFRNDKVLTHHVRDKQNHNEMKWHDLLKKQLKTNWDAVENHIKKNVGGENLTTYGNYFDELLKMYKKIDLAEERMTLLEQMIMAFENSLKQVVDENFRTNNNIGTNHMSSSIVSNGGVDQIENGSISQEFAAQTLRIIKDAQELRRITEKTRQTFGECESFLG